MLFQDYTEPAHPSAHKPPICVSDTNGVIVYILYLPVWFAILLKAPTYLCAQAITAIPFQAKIFVTFFSACATNSTV